MQQASSNLMMASTTPSQSGMEATLSSVARCARACRSCDRIKSSSGLLSSAAIRSIGIRRPKHREAICWRRAPPSAVAMFTTMPRACALASQVPADAVVGDRSRRSAAPSSKMPRARISSHRRRAPEQQARESCPRRKSAMQTKRRLVPSLGPQAKHAPGTASSACPSALMRDSKKPSVTKQSTKRKPRHCLNATQSSLPGGAQMEPSKA
mmetsp:Transcript_57523/g.154090  ORF Transcript_57523/g.154090 Transcript_57523/m.154090 type:complete len:210 (+) Transcript_57523:667-1296(+)